MDYRFGEYILEPREHRLRRGSQEFPLRPKTFETLLYLVKHHDRVVTKDDLLDDVWAGSFVVEAVVAHSISELRRTLKDDLHMPRYIKTIPKVGYKFVAPVSLVHPAVAEFQQARASIAVLPHRQLSPEGDVEYRSEELAGEAIPYLQRTPVAPSAELTGDRPEPRIDPIRRAVPWMIAFAGACFLVVSGVLWLRPWPLAERGPARTLKVVSLTSLPGIEEDACFSPDGSQIAFSWNGDIHVKTLGPQDPNRLTNCRGRDRSPAWSPDGQWIAFLRGRTGIKGRPLAARNKVAILRIPATGGPEEELALVFETHSYGTTLAWMPDSRWLVVPDQLDPDETTALFLLSAETREKYRLTSPTEGTEGDLYPAISPDGRTLAFVRTSALRLGDLYLLTLSDAYQPIGEPRRLVEIGEQTWGLCWTESGREIVYSAGHWTGARLHRIAISGEAASTVVLSPGLNAEHPSVSRRGHRLVFSEFTHDFDIWRRELLKSGGKAPPPIKFIDSTGVDYLPEYLPDGRVQFYSGRIEQPEATVCDSEGRNRTRLPFGGIWSPDGRWVAEDRKDSAGFSDIYLVDRQMGGKPEELARHPANDWVDGWSRDSKWIYFDSMRTGERAVWKISLETREPVQVTPAKTSRAVESPDGKSLYYFHVGEAGLWRIPTSGGEEELAVPEATSAGGVHIVQDGIYFITDDDTSWALRHLDRRTRDRRLVAEFQPPLPWGFCISPDEHYILYDRQESDADLFLVEDFH